jgi:DNA-binding XRE family transcriptional regulator
MTAPLNLVGAQVRKFRTRRSWTQETLAAKLQLAGWDVSRESLAKLEAELRRVPDCELLFLAKVLRVQVMDLFPARLDLKKLDPSLRLKVSTKHPRRKRRRGGRHRKQKLRLR